MLAIDDAAATIAYELEKRVNKLCLCRDVSQGSSYDAKRGVVEMRSSEINSNKTTRSALHVEASIYTSSSFLIPSLGLKGGG